MIEEVMPGIFRMEIPIPRSPLKATNSYLFKGPEHNLLIDTGQNCQEAFAVLRSGLAELAVDMKKTNIFLTHMHADHCGLMPQVRSEQTILYASKIDAGRINTLLTATDPLDFLFIAACRNGFAEEEAKQALGRHPGNDPGKKEPMQFQFAQEGFCLNVGEYHLQCIETPGHTDGHLCLYEPERGILLAGDHVLGDISPNITCYKETGNPLGDFLASLKKVAALKVNLVLPGHRRTFADCRGRIAELEEHHRRRLAEVHEILDDGPLNGYEVASRMTWDMVYDSWEDVAPVQKFFATGEALAHLRQLEAEGLVMHDRDGKDFIYRRNENRMQTDNGGVT